MGKRSFSKAQEDARKAVLEREQLIYRRHVHGKETLADIGLSLGITRQRASQLFNRAKKRSASAAKDG